MSDAIYSAAHARAIAEALDALTALDLRHDELGCHVRLGAEELELWSADAYRIGLIRLEDGHWVFEASYRDEAAQGDDDDN